jgi:PHD/YefM family antitoxin component YafN of YafNO toxin-antitoxin module
MQETKNIKEELHHLIDSINDEYTLNMVKEDIVSYMVSSEIDEDNDIDPVSLLTPEQLKDLDESIEEVERGETISFEEFQENVKKWLSR